VENTLDRSMAPVPFCQWPEFLVYRGQRVTPDQSPRVSYRH